MTEDTSLLPQASLTVSVKAPKSGYLSAVDTKEVGNAAFLLGAGRARKEDDVDPAVGVVIGNIDMVGCFFCGRHHSTVRRYRHIAERRPTHGHVHAKRLQRLTLSALRLKDVNTGATREIAVLGAFVAIGHEPTTKFLAGQLDLDDAGYVVVDRQRTSAKGVFAAGDCADSHYKQVVTAAATGCMAALERNDILQRRESWTEAIHTT